jgi:hypothetical protein
MRARGDRLKIGCKVGCAGKRTGEEEQPDETGDDE